MRQGGYGRGGPLRPGGTGRVKTRFHRLPAPRLTGPCCLLSAALFALSLAEAALRWDAMAPPVRIIFRMAATGKLTAGEIFGAVWPEIENGALTYPLCVLLVALCGLWGLGTILGRRRGFAAAAMCLCVLALTVLSGGGTALRAVHLLRCVLTAAAGCLFALRVFLSRPSPRGAPAGEGSADAGTGKGRVWNDDKSDRAHRAGGRLFNAKRRPLFRNEEERVRLFDHENGKNRRG